MSKARTRRRAPAPAVPDRAGDDLVRLPEVMRRTGLSRPTIYRKMEAGTFPPKLFISANCVAWYEANLVAWLADPTGWTAEKAAARTPDCGGLPTFCVPSYAQRRDLEPSKRGTGVVFLGGC